MKTSDLFEYCIIQDGATDADTPTVLVQPTALIAPSQDQALIKAARAIPAQVTNLDKVRVVVRPF